MSLPDQNPFVPAASVEQVLDRLDAVIGEAEACHSRTAFFALLYRNVTARVKDEIEAGRFDDAERMKHLDVIFANRFFDAMHGHRFDRPFTESWGVSFEAAKRWRPVILQHLLLGINAHINLDLGIAAALAAPGPALHGLRRDFDRINDILADMLEEVQKRLASVSPWFGLIDRIGGRKNDAVINLSVRASRRVAWETAVHFNNVPEGQREAAIVRFDRRVAGLARPIASPGLYVSTGLLLVRLRETSDVGRVVEALRI